MKGKGYITKVSPDGYGVLKLEKEIYIPYTVIGDFVKVKKTFRRFGRLIARDFEILEESPLRQNPKCPHFSKCGGCSWQHIKYKEQLNLKRRIFEEITGIEIPIKGSPKLWGFRNTSNFIVSTDGIGFKQRNSQSIANIRHCPVFSNRTSEFIKALKGFVDEEGLYPWDPRKKRGDIHYLSIREGKFTGEIMVNVISHHEEVPQSFLDYFEFANSLYWSFKEDPRDDPRGTPKLVGGSPFIREKIEGVIYLIHPNSFFQTNSYALPILLRWVLNFAEGGKILDLYSGVGTFGVFLAKEGFKVDGVDVNPFAVDMANKNAEINGVDASFFVKDAESFPVGDYDTVIVDPPRRGLKEAVKSLKKERPENIVYVSCNPQAFSRDYSHLRDIYRVEDAILIDMFPHTPHVEAIIKLKRR
ncbi:MAG: 23S rRNA (uracil(1939)-C(5))-methyltransferase RlmD [Thermococcus sp.]|nr:23S rRNA (uracil(1939)-C(5))-methyltransferase RlmD [Thermococcus sp.]